MGPQRPHFLMEETDRSHCLRQIDKVCSEKLECNTRGKHRKSLGSQHLCCLTLPESGGPGRTLCLCRAVLCWHPSSAPPHPSPHRGDFLSHNSASVSQKLTQVTPRMVRESKRAACSDLPENQSAGGSEGMMP